MGVSPSPRPRSSLRRAFRLGSLLTCVVLGLGGFQLYRRWAPQGEALHQRAWEASYTERGLDVPPMPRAGYWGSRIDQAEDQELGWRLKPVDLPGLIQVDGSGYQHAQSAASDRPRHQILILGGSVAGGAYAATQDGTYFARLARKLGEAGHPIDVTVVAAGSWVAGIELRALRRALKTVRPDVVLFLDGLNDLTVQRKLPLLQRPDAYLDYMREAGELASREGLALVYALQPFLLQKPEPTALERRILELSVKPASVWPFFLQAYPYLREGLAKLAATDRRRWFVDCSGVMDGETATTFADLWHFSDPGHELLAARLAEDLVPVLASLSDAQ